MFSRHWRSLTVTSALASIEDFGSPAIGAGAPARPNAKRPDASASGLAARLPEPRHWADNTTQLRRRRSLMLGVLALHLGLGWLLMRAHFRPPLTQAPTPITVNLLAAQAERPPEPPKLKLPAAPQAPVIPVMHFAIPTFNTQVSAAPTPTAVYAPVQQREPAPEAAPAIAAPVSVPTPPAIKHIAPNAVRYLVEPRLMVPLLSRRLGESGIVHLRIVVDARGQLKDASIKKSSGFERIDAQALQDIRTARFAPYLENGQPLEWETTALLSYELVR